jgi:hypothetical protein
MCIVVVQRIIPAEARGKPTLRNEWKAAVLPAQRQGGQDTTGGCGERSRSSEGELGNLGEPVVSWSTLPEEQGDRLTKSPGVGWELPLPNEPVRGHKARKQTG